MDLVSAFLTSRTNGMCVSALRDVATDPAVDHGVCRNTLTGIISWSLHIVMLVYFDECHA